MLGHMLFRSLSMNKDHIVYGTSRNTKGMEGFLSPKIISDIDITDLSSIDLVFKKLNPEIIINCVGIIKQLPTSAAPLSAIPINALFPHQLAALSAQHDAKLIHFSTDCVFSGAIGNYTELDKPDPNDLYSLTKLLGEVDDGRTLNLRTSIIGHELNHSTNSLLEWFLSQSGGVKGFRKAIFSGFPTAQIAKILENYIFPSLDKLSGTYHLSADPINKFELLNLINEAYKKGIVIEPDDTLSIDRSLNSNKLRKIIGYVPPSWPDLIAEMKQFG
jgi:dTDP-4-dehydrorhamnose reductase